MKKIYENPYLDIVHLLTSDVVTLSLGTASEDMGVDDENGERTQPWRFE